MYLDVQSFCIIEKPYIPDLMVTLSVPDFDLPKFSGLLPHRKPSPPDLMVTLSVSAIAGTPITGAIY